MWEYSKNVNKKRTKVNILICNKENFRPKEPNI